MNRADYMDGRVDHQTYYCAVVDTIGRDRIERLVRMVVPEPAVIKRLLESDEHLNNIPLARWDAMHPMVLSEVRRNGPAVMAVSWSGQPLKPGSICWSLSESVCVLKAAAKRMANELTAAG